jgi:hypothetical protein
MPLPSETSNPVVFWISIPVIQRLRLAMAATKDIAGAEPVQAAAGQVDRPIIRAHRNIEDCFVVPEVVVHICPVAAAVQGKKHAHAVPCAPDSTEFAGGFMFFISTCSPPLLFNGHFSRSAENLAGDFMTIFSSGYNECCHVVGPIYEP